MPKEVVAYIRTDSRTSKRTIIFANSTQEANARLFGDKLEPLVHAEETPDEQKEGNQVG